MSTSFRPKEAKLFRNNRNQAVRIPVEFEFSVDRVLIHRDGNRLIIEPLDQPMSLSNLLAQWATEPTLEPEDQFPSIEDAHIKPEDIF